ncbi:30S ribosome-binding factor RbfA [Clostridium sp. WILCCON 0269]|uniref:Ribosome-binding factor A n=1 Tax=Candidatus Clostridium eludens TaxID=3381663 RepID=A0ABW8SIU1_9CLOT
MTNYRSGRINEEMKREISNVIRNDIKDPRLSAMVSVTKVDVTKDQKYAKVFVSIYGEDSSKEDTFQALKNSEGFIRREVGHRVKLRNTPEIIIEMDNTIEYGMHINELLHKIKENEKHDNE